MLFPRLFALLLLPVLALLGGCVGTQYSDGYTTDFQIGENTWISYYEGNSAMSRPLVLEYAIGQTAGIALAKGYSYYRIIDIGQEVDANTYYTPAMYTVTSSFIGGDGTIRERGYVEGGNPVTVVKNSASITFEGYKEYVQGALEAQKVWDEFRAKYLQPQK